LQPPGLKHRKNFKQRHFQAVCAGKRANQRIVETNFKKKDTVLIELDHFRSHNKTEVRIIGKAAETFGYFSGKKTEVKFE
jgi:hypothetical protein